MGFRLPGASLFAFGLTARALLIGVAAFGVLELLLPAHLYATALVLVGAAVLLAFDLRRSVLRADLALGRLVDGLAAGDLDRAGRGAAGFQRFGDAIERAAARMQAERSPRQRRIEYLQALADAVPAALVAVEDDGRVALANRAARALAGEDVAQLSDLAALGPELAARLLALGPGARQVVRLPDGRQMLASTLQFRTPGAPAQRLISLQDIALELDAVELKAWQDLVRVLAHEMLNSLTPISSLAESLQQRLDRPSEIASAVDVIARRSLGLMNFVDRYRKVAEAPSPVLAPVMLAPFISGLDQLMGPTFGAARVNFKSRVDPPNLTLSGDAELLEQAVINLLKNAIDAVATAEDPTIVLTCRQRGDRVEITVSDNGAGFSKDAEDKLFVPFFTTKPQGSGIGLSVARQIALAHHGQLEARSLQPHGAAFTLVLPAPVDG